MTASVIEVVLVEDHAEFRAGLLALLNGTPGFRAQGFDRCENAIASIAGSVPDIVVMDIKLPGQDGIHGTRLIKKGWPHVQVMMCTVHEDDGMIFSALRAGATGYILKRSPFGEILDALHMIHRGGSPMSPAIARRVVDSFQQLPRPDDPNALTAREQDVLDLMATGLRDKEIADQLGISTNTVRTHIRHIYEKLQVQGRVEAVNRSRGKRP